MFSNIGTLTFKTFVNQPPSNLSQFRKYMSYFLVLAGLCITYQAKGWFHRHDLSTFTSYRDDLTTEAFFTSVSPADQASDVNPYKLQISVGLVVPNGFELDENTLDGNVKLFEKVGSQLIEVPANINDTGGGDVVILSPLATIREFATYVFRIEEGVQANQIGDATRRVTFAPFSSSFRTGAIRKEAPRNLTNVSFTRVEEIGKGIQTRFTSLVIGPDKKLYATTFGETIHRWKINPDGTLDSLERLNPDLRGAISPATGIPASDERIIIGIAFDPQSTAENPIAYVTHSAASLTNAPEWDGKISQLRGENLTVVKDVVIHLPRSTKDHLTNSIVFGPDHALYFNQGSNTAGGDPDPAWGNRPETLLAAAVLKLDLSKLPEASWPLSAYTSNDIAVINAAPQNQIQMSDGTYNPYAVNSPLTIFATGVRNAYDLIWHKNGFLYVPNNGTGGNNINSPNAPSSDAYINIAGLNAGVRRIDGTFYKYPQFPRVPAVVGGETQKDFLIKALPFSYHGHPNPLRGEFVLNQGGRAYQGLPGQAADELYVDVAKYSNEIEPDPYYISPAFDFGKNKSPNGVIEYQSNAFGGSLKGMLLIARFSGQDDIMALQASNTNGDIIASFENIPGLQGFDDPLDLVEDPNTGNLYVIEFDRGSQVNSRITLLRANQPASVNPQISIRPQELIFNAKKGIITEPQIFSVSNPGSVPLEISNVNIEGDLANLFALEGTTDLVLSPGQTADFAIRFIPGETTDNAGFISVDFSLSTNDPDNPNLRRGIYALKTRGNFGGNEPRLSDIVKTLGYDIDVGWNKLANGTSPVPIGDEIISPLFVKARGGAVTMKPVGRYSPREELPFGWYDASSEQKNELGIIKGDSPNAQTLFPQLKSGGITFNPDALPFGLYFFSKSFDRFTFTEDQFNEPTESGSKHRVRIYPLKDRVGNPLENEYLICFEDASNGDYQDYMFVLSNVRPYQEAALAFQASSVKTSVCAGEISRPKTLSLSSNYFLDNNAFTIQLETASPWLLIPNTLTPDEDLTFQVDAQTLIPGMYEASVKASTPGFGEVFVNIQVKVTELQTWQYQVNFQDTSVRPPDTFGADTGEPFGPKTLNSNPIHFGWVELGTDTPAANEELARNRRIEDLGRLENTLNHLSHPAPNRFPPRDWLIELANGTYLVRASVGDPSEFNDSRHVLTANGTEIVRFNEEVEGSQSGIKNKVDTALVEVKDGILRLSQGNDGFNTKVNYIQIAPYDSTGPLISTRLEGLFLQPGQYRGRATLIIEAEDQIGELAYTAYSADGGQTFQDYLLPVVFEQVDDYQVITQAVDKVGNISQDTINFQIVPASGALIAIENMTKIPGTNQGFPADDFYAFHRTKRPIDLKGNITKVKDRNTVRIHNSGDQALVISDIYTSDISQFRVNLPEDTFPISIVSTGSYDVEIQFVENSEQRGVYTQSLSIVSNADNKDTTRAVLKAGYMRDTEGGNEMQSQRVMEVTGFTTSMGERRRPSSDFPLAEDVEAGIYGDYILATTFEQADPSQPVIGMGLAAFHGAARDFVKLTKVENDDRVGDFFFRHDADYSQTILPQSDKVEGQIAGDQAALISEPFRINIQDYRSTGGTTNEQRVDELLGIRLYKARDQQGAIIPFTYIVLQDFVNQGCGTASANCDFNDNIALFYNIRPEAKPTALAIPELLTQVDAPFEYNISEFFDQGYPGNNLGFSANLAESLEPLPDWMHIDETTGIISGQAPFNADNPTIVAITATDDNGVSVSENLALVIEGAYSQLLGLDKAEVDFGKLRDDKVAEQEVAVKYIGAENLPRVFIRKIEIVGDTAEVFRFDQRKLALNYKFGDESSFIVRFDPQNQGLYQARILIHTDYSEKPLVLKLKGIKNQVPIAQRQRVLTIEDTPISFSLLVSDADDEELNYELTQNTRHGVLTGDFPNLTYTPNPDFNNNSFQTVDQFFYKVKDALGDSAQARVTIQVRPINDAPQFKLQSAVLGHTGSGLKQIPQWASDMEDNDPEAFQSLEFELYTPQPELFTILPTMSPQGTFVYEFKEGLESTVLVNVGLRDDGSGNAPNDNYTEKSFIIKLGEDLSIDADGDGFPSEVDCNDFDASINPAALESCDGIDNNCNTEVDEGSLCDTLKALRINAGGGEIQAYGLTFEADKYFQQGNIGRNNQAQVRNTNEDRLYRSERFGKNFQYNIPIADGAYLLKLHFAEVYWGVLTNARDANGKRRFEVLAEDQLLLSDYDINAFVGPATAHIREFNVQVEGGVLNLAFQLGEDGLNNAKVSAIEVIPIQAGVCEVPSPWISRGINRAGGKGCFQNGIFTVSAAGRDIWNEEDEFRFVHQSLVGDGEIIAKVNALSNTDPWTKAGIMIRETTAGNAKHSAVVITPRRGLNMQTRATTGANPVFVGGFGLPVAKWLRLQRIGDKVFGYRSNDPSQEGWQLIGESVLSTRGRLLFGLAVSSHNRDKIAQAAFESVQVIAYEDANLPSNDANNQQNLEIKVYPNEMDEKQSINLVLSKPITEMLDYTLYDVFGRSLKKGQQKVEEGNTHLDFSDLRLQAGIYYLKVIGDRVEIRVIRIAKK